MPFAHSANKKFSWCFELSMVLVKADQPISTIATELK